MNAPEAPQLGLHRACPPSDTTASPRCRPEAWKRMRMSPAHFYGLQMDPERPRSG